MKKFVGAAALLAAILVFHGCGKKTDGATSTGDAVGDSANSAITAAAGVMDEQGNQGFAKLDLTGGQRALAALENIVIPENAWGATCSSQGRAFTAACSSGVRTASYSGCTMGLGTLTGSITLNYSQALCTLSSTNDNVTRVMDVTLTGAGGGTLQSTATSNTAYDGTSVGGGQKLTKTAGGYQVDILGVHKILQTSGGVKLFDFNVKTSSPLVVTGGLTRGTRTIASGAIQVLHNLARFTATHTFSNVAWTDSSCCYPTSGSITTSFTGANLPATSATITFSSTCGAATETKDGATTSITLSNCE